MNLFKKIAPLGILVLACLPLQSAAQTTVTYTADSTMSDAMVANGGVENSNFGSQNQFNVYYQVNQQIPMAFRTFIQYDLNAIPSNATITEAKLKFMTLSVNNAITHDLYVERVGTTSWTENTITWNNQPSVISSDQITIPHAQTSSTGLHEFTVTDHVQKMIANPTANNGWRIRLRGESGSADFGLMYYSSEASNVAKRPVLSITYTLPLEMETTVNHCTAGATDGTMSIAVSGGGTYSLSNMFFYKTNRDTTHVGKATLSNAKVINNLQYNAVTGVVSADNLEPGIYILRILDSPYYINSDLRHAHYKHILVGREGETTSGILLPNYQYQENVTIEYDKPTNTTPLGRANTNYHTQSTLIPLRIADAPNNYEKASLIKYQLDFDDQLEFSAAELKITAWSKFFRHNNSSNAVNYSIVTEDWHESDVTWNTRPAIDSSITVNVPTTTYIGYDPVHKIDTVDILSFVEYWQDNPNHGFEMALETYGATQFASREYKSSITNSNFVYFEWSVKEAVEVAFNDTTNTGTLTVNAPTGILPYTYLINTQPLGTLADIWAEIGDSTLVDSLNFFSGDVNSTQFTFTDLPSGKYYIGVYDNTGAKILDGNGIVNTQIQLYNDTDLDLSSSNVITRSSGSQGDGKGRLHAELLADNSWGGLSFTPEIIGAFCIGFNKTSDAVASAATDLEFGISVDAQGAYQIIENNVLLGSVGSITAGQEISILRDHEKYVLYINGNEVYSDGILNLDGEDISTDLILIGVTAEIKLEHYIGQYKRPAPEISVTYPECGTFSGAISISAGVGGTIVSATLDNNDGVSPDPLGACAIDGSNCVFPVVPIGTYTLSISYSVAPMGGAYGYSYTTTEQVAVGYVVEWEDTVNNYVSPLNTIRKGPGPMIPTGWATANSTNMTVTGYPNWVHFETDVSSLFATSLNREKLMLRNQAGGVIYMLETALVPGTSMAYQGELGLTGMSLLSAPNGVWRIEQDGDQYSLFKNNMSVVSLTTETDAAPPIYEIAIEQNGSAKYIKTIASFCSDYGIADQYIEPKRSIEGGYYIVPSDDTLRFEFNEEYTITGNLNYTVTNFIGEETVLDDLVEIFGDNRFLLDVSALASGTYLLEIENDKEENWFIRFKIN